jgi:hypothetical protein
MKPQQKSSTEPVKAGNLANLSSSERLNLRETMNRTEAMEWIRRYKKKILEDGRVEAYNWWTDTLADIEKKRGKQAVDELRERMNALKESND